MIYKNKIVFFVVNYERIDFIMDVLEAVSVQEIKSIYINETESAFCRYYLHPRIPCWDVFPAVGCVVFIETLPKEEIPVKSAKGVRKTWLEGYSRISEFYSPNYSELQPIPDYRRTLYWNPTVTTDENGKAKIEFYNNSSCTKFSISAETVTPSGMIGIYN